MACENNGKTCPGLIKAHEAIAELVTLGIETHANTAQTKTNSGNRTIPPDGMIIGMLRFCLFRARPSSNAPTAI